MTNNKALKVNWVVNVHFYEATIQGSLWEVVVKHLVFVVYYFTSLNTVQQVDSNDYS